MTSNQLLTTPAAGTALRRISPSNQQVQVVTVGETMGLIQAGDPGSFAHAGAAHISVGGAESNVAIGLARLGASAAWIGRVGEDGLGERVIRQIRGEGVNVYAVADPGRPTGLMLKSKPLAGQTRVDYYRREGAGAALGPEDLPEALIESARILHITGISAVLSDCTYEAVSAAVGRAKSAGVAISFDINHRQSLAAADWAAPRYRTLVAEADIVFGGAEEIALLDSPGGMEPAVQEQLERGDDKELPSILSRYAAEFECTMVLKRGPQGAAQATRAGEYSAAEGLRVQVVDTVGAGDAFVAGYLSATLERLGAQASLERGNACGAIMCTSPGDWEAAARPEHINHLLNGGSHDPVQR